MSFRHDLIWNRAVLEGGGQKPSIGDSALANMLKAHSAIMNGGVAHALECMNQTELDDAISGYRYFGISSAADVLSQVFDNTDEMEHRLNLAYWHVVPDDSILEDAFQRKLLTEPDAFTLDPSNE
jgi:hypothetical protein